MIDIEKIRVMKNLSYFEIACYVNLYMTCIHQAYCSTRYTTINTVVLFYECPLTAPCRSSDVKFSLLCQSKGIPPFSTDRQIGGMCSRPGMLYPYVPVWYRFQVAKPPINDRGR